ncbi:MAG: outer membrane beta-barrel protein, partial [bacterium]
HYVRLPRAQWSDQGFEYRFSLGVLKLHNGQALSYSPLEVGYRFRDGWRMRLGLEAFYYDGMDSDTSTGPTSQLFYYQMEDIRLSVLYEWFRHHSLRPFAGVTLESVFGTRQLAVNPTPDTGESFESAYSFEAPGAEAGLEYRGGPSWSVSWEARYVQGFGSWANLAGSDLGWHYLF